MWAFEKFPSKIKLKRKYEDGPEYDIEVFGYVNKIIIMFRRISIGVTTDMGEIELLPIREFEEEFKKYKLTR